MFSTTSVEDKTSDLNLKKKKIKIMMESAKSWLKWLPSTFDFWHFWTWLFFLVWNKYLSSLYLWKCWYFGSKIFSDLLWENIVLEMQKNFLISKLKAKLSTPSTLNIDFIQWHTQLIMCAVKWITHDLIHDFHFTFQAYALPHTLNGIYVSLFKFHTWILRQF